MGFIHSDNKQFKEEIKYMQTLKSKIILECDIQNLVAPLPRIDSIEVQGSNPIIFESEQNINVDPMLLHEEIINVPSIILKFFEDVQCQCEVEPHDPNIYQSPPSSQMPLLSNI